MGMLRPMALATMFAMALTGCSGLRSNPTACKVGTFLTGATLGAVGGGVGTHNIEKDASNGETAAGAGVGLVAGGLLGMLAGHYICREEAPPPPPPPPPPPAPKKIETLQGAHFDFNKAELKPTGKEKLDRVAKVIQENPDMRISIEGYTDSIGSDAYNLKLSERRANSARDYLISRGVSPSRITTIGYGKSNPVASNATEEGRAQNRRVEIIAR